ncbi:MAG TPA: YdcF family protein [Rhizomicrobium sp.]|nr:YdcF family protein [Rhizomicrobium sp.]
MLYFFLSRFLLDPTAWVLSLMIAALIAGHYRRRKLQDGLIVGAGLFLVALFLFPLDYIVARPLENAYPRPPLPAHVDGIVVLDGALNSDVFATRHVLGENGSTMRLIAGAELARRFPNAKLIYSGTSEETPQDRLREHMTAVSLLEALDIPPGRTIFESTSRNTGEDLANSMKLVHPKPGEIWMLVTSAVHMPRAMAVAKRLGWQMTPWPSNYISPTGGDDLRIGDPSDSFHNFHAALHEWVGLAVYRLTGRGGG